jgi:single-stranded-DNA-specific exonuclease
VKGGAALTSGKWKLLPRCPDHLHQGLNRLSPLLVQLLYNRGISDPGMFEAFLDCDSRLSCDPFSLPDIHQAVSRIFRGLLAGEKILVFGDFDADGITASVLLVEGLEALGGDVSVYLPHRTQEGHGLSSPALDEFKQAGITLLITVDCGITSVLEVERARSLGIDVIITDHHTVSTNVPAACAVIDPKRPDSAYLYPHLAGVGVAYKLLEALFAGTGRAVEPADALALVALGTIADMSPLNGENRYLVKRGLVALGASKRPGIVALLRGIRQPSDGIGSRFVGWEIAPRLNAAGRIEHARVAYNLLRTRSNEEAEHLASQLEEVNRERQSLLEVHWNRARKVVIESQSNQLLLLVGDSEYPAGVCGLVASRLVDEFRRPAIVLQICQEDARGSCRSVPEFDIIAALGGCTDLLRQFGGHPAAAGFSMRTDLMDVLSRRLLLKAEEKLAGMDLSKAIVIDAEVDPGIFLGETFAAIQELAPFGQGNPSPVFLARKVYVVEARPVGNAGQHLKLKLRSGNILWQSIGFDLSGRSVQAGTQVDIVYSPQVNRWNGSESMELNIADLRPSGS